MAIVCNGHSRPVVDVRFLDTTGDALNLLVSSCHDKTAQVRWAQDGAWIGTFQGHNGAVWSTAMDSAGLRAATGSADFSAKLWDAERGKELATFPHQHVVKAVDFSFDSRSLLSAGLERKSFVFDLDTQTQTTKFEHPCQVTRAVWIEDHTFLTGAYDGQIRMWDVREAESTKGCQSVQLVADGAFAKKGITDLQFNKPMGTFVSSIGRKVYVVDQRKFDAPLLLTGTYFDVEAASLSPNGKRIVAGGSDLWLHVFDAAERDDNGNCKEVSVNRGHHGPIFCVRWNVDGKSVASGSEDGTIRIWPTISSV